MGARWRFPQGEELKALQAGVSAGRGAEADHGDCVARLIFFLSGASFELQETPVGGEAAWVEGLALLPVTRVF